MAFIERFGERMYEAEIHRLKGMYHLKLDPGSAAEAEKSLLRAIDAVRSQQDRLFELRASLSLGRLWQKQGRRNEGRTLVSEIYDWFTEGFDTSTCGKLGNSSKNWLRLESAIRQVNGAVDE